METSTSVGIERPSLGNLWEVPVEVEAADTMLAQEESSLAGDTVVSPMGAVAEQAA